MKLDDVVPGHTDYMFMTYSYGGPGGEPYVLDGWFISFHHTDPAAVCPPDPAVGDPTVLGVYFAPVDAVEIVSVGYDDCFNHEVYEYVVDLSRCCLLCSEADPRDGNAPAQPESFLEVDDFGYWLDIQAVTGVEWVPDPANPGQCIKNLTGHLPSDMTADGHFWGWHTSFTDRLNEACTGRISDVSPYPPDCWDYGNWQTQAWLCPTSVPQPVNMSFELLTAELGPFCPHADVDTNGLVDGLDIAMVRSTANWNKLVDDALNWRADVDGSGVVDGLDIAMIRSTACWQNP